jgi:hypothetical protein
MMPLTEAAPTTTIGNTSWSCPTCKQTVLTTYCAVCGERALEPRELTLRGIFEQAVEAFTNLDSRLIRSLLFVVIRPGMLTKAYLAGQRLPYLRPLQLFLIANVLFFAMESLTHSTIFSTPLDSHLHTQPWSDFAQWLVPYRLMSTQTSLEAYAPDFDRAIALNARSLVVLMSLAFVPFLTIAFSRTRRPFVIDVVFSLHLYAFVLILFSGALMIAAVSALLGGPGLVSENMDNALSIGLLLACAAYLYIATGVVYNVKGAAKFTKALVLTAAVASVVLAYRFGLFLLTLYTT